jgi:hypothetical protein
VTESLNITLRLLVANLTLFAVFLCGSFLFTIIAFFMSIFSIYPMPFDVNVEGPKGKKGQTTLENFKNPQKNIEKCL